MTFSTGFQSSIQGVGGGEISSEPNVIIGFTNFEDDLKIGHFAKWDTSRLDNMDGSSTPVLAGVVIRTPANAVASGDTYDTANWNQVSVIHKGICTVKVKTGETPALFDDLFVSNTAGSYGEATATNTDLPANGKFLREVSTGYWSVYFDLISNDVTAHTADTTAHAASSITVLDAGTLLTATNVETALAEIAGEVDAHIADTSDAHDASAISVADAGELLTATTVEAALAEIAGEVDDHIADTSDAHDASAISVLDTGELLTATDVEAALAEIITGLAAHVAGTDSNHLYEIVEVTDPGDGVAIPVDTSAYIGMTINGTETNTCAIPDFVGQKLILVADTVTSGTRAITFASAINVAGNTVATFGEARDTLIVEGITLAGTLCWQVTENANVVLS